jgi:hypothetical protein
MLASAVPWVPADDPQPTAKRASKPGPGRPIEIANVEPWPAAVGGAELLDELAAALHKYIILSDAEADATTLWLVRTHAHDAFDFNPPLWVRSVEKRSGKTRLCEVAERVAAKALLVSSVSASALLRVVETDRPCVILDELDALLRKSPELAEAVRGLINSSFNRNAARHLMCVPGTGGGYEVREFSMWAPLWLSGIGELPDTARDRAIGIEMKRKRRDEKVARLRQRDGRDLQELARKVARWAGDHMEALGDAQPEMPGWLNDRAADGWEPLFAIANLAGGDWRRRAEDAARALSGDEAAEDSSVRIKLLADIRDIFDDANEETLFSREIVEKLVDLDDRPWAEWGKSGKPITTTRMSRLLSPLLPPGVKPGTVRRGDKSGKGYHRKDLEDLFLRYLPISPPSKPSQRHKPQKTRGFPESQSVTPNLDVTFSKSPKAAQSATCDAVTVSHHPRGGDENKGIDVDLPRGERPQAPQQVSPDRPKRGRITL